MSTTVIECRSRLSVWTTQPQRAVDCTRHRAMAVHWVLQNAALTSRPARARLPCRSTSIHYHCHWDLPQSPRQRFSTITHDGSCIVRCSVDITGTIATVVAGILQSTFDSAMVPQVNQQKKASFKSDRNKAKVTPWIRISEFIVLIQNVYLHRQASRLVVKVQSFLGRCRIDPFFRMANLSHGYSRGPTLPRELILDCVDVSAFHCV
jgi:hypothetical protein